jgi:hypothetical protein
LGCSSSEVTLVGLPKHVFWYLYSGLHGAYKRTKRGMGWTERMGQKSAPARSVAGGAGVLQAAELGPPSAPLTLLEALEGQRLCAPV